MHHAAIHHDPGQRFADRENSVKATKYSYELVPAELIDSCHARRAALDHNTDVLCPQRERLFGLYARGPLG